MPEDEVQPAEGGGGGLMNGSRGWIIVISIVVLEAVFFIVLLKYRSDRSPADTSTSSGIESMKEDDFMPVIIPLDGLTYSIPMPSGNPMTLAMSLNIVLGKTPKEIQNNVKILPQDWEKFKAVVTKMKPLIKDWLYQTINKMSSSELETERGMQDIRGYVQAKVNEELKRINFELSNENIDKARVTKVLITNYYFN